VVIKVNPKLLPKIKTKQVEYLVVIKVNLKLLPKIKTKQVDYLVVKTRTN